MNARDLLFVLLLVGFPVEAWRALRGPPPLGPPHPETPCPHPVERAGEGVVCAGGGTSAATKMAPARLQAFEVPIDLNHAGADELASLDGIGPKLAAKILRARQEQPFRSVDELARVRGIGSRRIEKLRFRLLVTPATSR